jgi:hypothetical protein
VRPLERPEAHPVVPVASEHRDEIVREFGVPRHTAAYRRFLVRHKALRERARQPHPRRRVDIHRLVGRHRRIAGLGLVVRRQPPHDVGRDLRIRQQLSADGVVVVLGQRLVDLDRRVVLDRLPGLLEAGGDRLADEQARIAGQPDQDVVRHLDPAHQSGADAFVRAAREDLHRRGRQPARRGPGDDRALDILIVGLRQHEEKVIGNREVGGEAGNDRIDVGHDRSLEPPRPPWKHARRRPDESGFRRY